MVHYLDNPKWKHLWNKNTTNAPISGNLGVLQGLKQLHALEMDVKIIHQLYNRKETH